MADHKKPRDPDHVRRANGPGPEDETLEAQFEELLSPAIYSQLTYYRSQIVARVSKDTAHIRPLLSVPDPRERIDELLQEGNDKYHRFPQIVTDQKEPTAIVRNPIDFINTDPKSIVIENPHKNYEYVVGAGLLPFIRQLTGIEGEIVVIIVDIVKAFYGPCFASIGRIIEIPSGRQHKSLETVQFVYDQLLDKSFDRTGSIILLGGSIVGDIAGYVAATFMRGVNFVQCLQA